MDNFGFRPLIECSVNIKRTHRINYLEPKLWLSPNLAVTKSKTKTIHYKTRIKLKKKFFFVSIKLRTDKANEDQQRAASLSFH